MDTKELLSFKEQVRVGRLFWVEHEGKRYQVSRPTQVDMISSTRLDGYASMVYSATNHIVGWEGFTKSDFDGSDDKTEVIFDRDLLKVYLGENPKAANHVLNEVWAAVAKLDAEKKT